MKNSICFSNVFVGALTLAATAALNADILRASSATATSEFSGLYDIGNAIDGSGLSAGFNPASTHATYTTNNHWTTESGRTIGESATFSFTMPAPVGGFYMWAHRSNNIASNPHYAVTLFDLVFRDASGNILQTIPNLVGIPNVLTAQTYAFPVIQNVKTVQFIVRATANNNSSPFTGLAEALFDTCIAVSASIPGEQVICPGGTVTIPAQLGGSGPFTTRWERVDSGGNAVTLTDGALPGSSAVISGSSGATLTISGVDEAAASYTYRIVASNSCSQTSAASTVVYCPSDANCDGFVDFFDYDDFVTAFEAGTASADFNGDGFIDFFDYDDFVAAFEAGC
jgi:hypothetical protein